MHCYRNLFDFYELNVVYDTWFSYLTQLQLKHFLGWKPKRDLLEDSSWVDFLQFVQKKNKGQSKGGIMNLMDETTVVDF